MSFSSDLNRITKKAQNNIDLVTRKVASDMFTSVIKKTPIKTGRARGNWSASIGEYSHSFNFEMSDKTGATTTSKAVSVANQSEAGNVTYLVNNLPYIRPLEYGSSKQAPQGMVRLTVEEYSEHVSRAVRAIR